MCTPLSGLIRTPLPSARAYAYAALVLAPDAPLTHVATATVAAFYSISAAHPGLRGASLGNLLIRRTLAAVPTQVDFRA